MKYSKRTIKHFRQSILIEYMMCGLVVISLATIPLYFLDIDEQYIRRIELFDVSASIAFSIEFAVRLYRASNRTGYLRSYWWLVLAAIPIPGVASSLLRTFRLLGIVKLLKILDHYEYERLNTPR